MRTYAEWREILKDQSLPAVVVDLDAFDRNVAKLAQILKVDSNGSKTLRLATKSVRVPELIARVLKAGAPYQGLMCFAAAEAGQLAAAGFDDFLLAYPTLQSADLACLRALHDAGKTVTIVVDSQEGVAALARAMTGASRPFPVLLDVDASLRLLGGLLHLGVRRSPVRTVADALTLARGIAAEKSLRLIGLMEYEAQVAGMGDRNPFKRLMNPIFALVRAASVKAVAAQRARIVRELTENGIKIELVNGGGTGSVTYAVHERVLTELTAGSGLLCSHLFDYYSNVSFEPACFFALQAVRSSDVGYVTCLGGGYVASGEAGADKLPRPYLPVGLSLTGAEGAGEVQTPLQNSGGALIKLGDPVLFRHAKAGELAERFNEYLLVSGGRIVSRAKTYRGLGWSFF